MIASSCVGALAHVAGRQMALGTFIPFLWLLLFWFTLGGLYAMESDRQVLGAVADVVELLENQLDLLREFASAGARSEFDGLDERTLKLLIKLMSCLDFKDIISKSNQIGDSLHFKLLLTF